MAGWPPESTTNQPNDFAEAGIFGVWWREADLSTVSVDKRYAVDRGEREFHPSGRTAVDWVLLFPAGCLEVAVKSVRYHVGYNPAGVTEEFVPNAIVRCERRLRKSDQQKSTRTI